MAEDEVERFRLVAEVRAPPSVLQAVVRVDARVREERGDHFAGRPLARGLEGGRRVDARVLEEDSHACLVVPAGRIAQRFLDEVHGEVVGGDVREEVDGPGLRVARDSGEGPLEEEGPVARQWMREEELEDFRLLAMKRLAEREVSVGRRVDARVREEHPHHLDFVGTPDGLDQHVVELPRPVVVRKVVEPGHRVDVRLVEDATNDVRVPAADRADERVVGDFEMRQRQHLLGLVAVATCEGHVAHVFRQRHELGEELHDLERAMAARLEQCPRRWFKAALNEEVRHLDAPAGVLEQDGVRDICARVFEEAGNDFKAIRASGPGERTAGSDARDIRSHARVLEKSVDNRDVTPSARLVERAMFVGRRVDARVAEEAFDDVDIGEVARNPDGFVLEGRRVGTRVAEEAFDHSELVVVDRLHECAVELDGGVRAREDVLELREAPALGEFGDVAREGLGLNLLEERIPPGGAVETAEACNRILGLVLRDEFRDELHLRPKRRRLVCSRFRFHSSSFPQASSKTSWM